ncbi:hypothetical protein TELCIR_23235 [Teladorsagia circumcincta]|uniref:Uncharacterized protein n=1 Tax=Teladorsagia circumcincta TaxID=45464 RepID=A0A2G9TBN6_TELCI|nr:hypothetical protein TELCIR_23235 [Teladorsagia circumcincta]
MPGNVNPKGPIPPESTPRRKAAGKQDVDTRPDVAKKPELGVRRKPSRSTTQSNVTNKPEPSVQRKKDVAATTLPLDNKATTSPAASKPPAVAQLPAAAQSPATGQQPDAVQSPAPGSVPTTPTQGAKAEFDIDTTSPAVTPRKSKSLKDKKPTPPRIQLEKETKEQILAAIEEAPGDDDNSSLISLQPSQSEVNIDVQKKVVSGSGIFISSYNRYISLSNIRLD